jgi:preprotein translocase subunit SecG
MDDSFAALGYPAASMTADFVKFDKSDISITKGGISKQVRLNETNCYLLDLQISEGNSGGPVVNSKGEVVGINTFYIVDKAKSANAADVKSNYAVAIDELMRNIDRNVIPYTVTGEMTQLKMLYIGIAAVVVILILVFVILLENKKKNRGAGVAAASSFAADSPQMSTSPVPPIPSAPTASLNKATITGVSGPLANRSFNINGKIVIGRDPSRCGVSFPLDAPGVSGVHCELSVNNGSIYLKDLNSTYGTYLANGTKLSANTPVKINAGDKFYLGGEDNKFEVR